MTHRILLILFLSLLVITSCTKTNTQDPACYQCIDVIGNMLGSYCGNTEQEAFIKAGGTINGQPASIELFREWCPRTDLPEYCWKITTSATDYYYLKDTPEWYVNKFTGSGAKTKINCLTNSDCEEWIVRQKAVQISTGNIKYTNITTQNYCGDTLYNIHSHKLIVTRTAPDSIFYHEFVSRK